MRVSKWGNSLAVRIPKDVAEALQLRDGTEIDLVPMEAGLGISRRMTREEALLGLRKFRGTMPADFKFDREEANAR